METVISSAVGIIGALISCVSAFYSFMQVKEARRSVAKAEEAAREAATQNRISALLALKQHLETNLPQIKKMADHFATPETMNESAALNAEHEQGRKRLQRVNNAIEDLYEKYIPKRD